MAPECAANRLTMPPTPLGVAQHLQHGDQRLELTNSALMEASRPRKRVVTPTSLFFCAVIPLGLPLPKLAFEPEQDGAQLLCELDRCRLWLAGFGIEEIQRGALFGMQSLGSGIMVFQRPGPAPLV